MACLDEPTVVAFVAGKLTGAAAESIDEHLAECGACRDLVVLAARTTFAIGSAPTQDGREPVEPPIASEVGGERYTITSLIGAGGQALVYAADDRVLGRTVALKVLSGEHPGRDDRILQEARMVARLSHPHIVAIYDAGTTRDGGIYLAMELVGGGSLASWLRTPRPADEILRVCLEAGRGVAAAHAAGILHRDVKPANILIGDDGRARVTDFGLAVDDSRPAELVGTRAIAGTLAYMAPEQLAARPERASDQFSLAVTIWEALAGANPFDGSTIDARRRSIERGPPTAPSALPRRVATALRRALAAEPSARFASVADLVAALADGPRRRRRARVIYAGLGITAVAAGTLAFALASSRDSRPACVALDDRLRGVWDDGTRQRLSRQFQTLSEAYAATTAASTRHVLDDYAAGWIASRTRACEATMVYGDQPESVLALRNACLDERASALGAAVKVLASADRDIARHALEIVDGLPALAPCDDTTWLGQRVRPPTDPSSAAQVAAIESLLATSATTLRAGKIKDAIAIAARAVELVTAIDHAPTRAHAEFVLGDAQAHLPDNVAAEASFEQAAQWAQRGRDDRLAASAFIELVKVIGHGLGRYDEALRQGGFAEATITRLGDDPVLRASLEYHRCAVYDQAAKFDEANKSCAVALAAREAKYGKIDTSVADVLILQARLATNQHHYADAVTLAGRALAIREKLLGTNHPALTEALFTLGQVDLRLGKLDDADASYRRAMAVARPAFGDDSQVMGALWAEQAVVASMRGDLAAALADIDRSTEIRERLEGANHVDLVFNLTQRGRILEDLGKPADAAAALSRAQQIAAGALGPDHPSVAAILQDLGRLHGKLGDRVLARQELDRAIAIADKRGDNAGRASGESALAEFLHGGHLPREAIPHYEAALSRFETTFGADSPELIPTLENLGLAHIDVHEPAAALPLVERAIVLEQARSGPSSSRLLLPLTSLGQAQLDLGRRGDAKATWKRALALDRIAEEFPDDVTDVKQRLAKL